MDQQASSFQGSTQGNTRPLARLWGETYPITEEDNGGNIAKYGTYHTTGTGTYVADNEFDDFG